MRFLVTAQPNPNDPPSNGEAAFDEATFRAYMAFNEEMYKAGILVAAEGLNPNGRGGHVIVKEGKRVAMDGPFAETKELVGGFYLIDVPSLEAALEFARKCPTGLGFDNVLEVRPLTEAGDIPPRFRELIEQAAPTWSAAFIKGR